MIELQYQPLHGKKWRTLSVAYGEVHSCRHLFGWSVVLGSGSWRTNESMGRLEELIAVLRQREAILSAPALIDQLEEMGMCVWVENEQIRLKGVGLTDELREKIKACKPELIKLLADVPKWSDEEASVLEKKVKDAHQMVYVYLHPDAGSINDDCFADAARNVCADLLGSISKARAVRRIDHMRRRCDFVLGWFATLDERIHDMRDPKCVKWSQNRKTINYKDFEGAKT
ncbi:MAG: hypothetical protein E6R03_15200 [Hyphomicrobiaceae bacterium]|nr:MAG: hypothetical protein E6R03_15200 [Hyphomicrobiaceae bacterium]